MGSHLFSSLVFFLLGPQRHVEAFQSIATELAFQLALGATVGLPLDGAFGGRQ